MMKGLCNVCILNDVDSTCVFKFYIVCWGSIQWISKAEDCFIFFTICSDGSEYHKQATIFAPRDFDVLQFFYIRYGPMF